MTQNIVSEKLKLKISENPDVSVQDFDLKNRANKVFTFPNKPITYTDNIVISNGSIPLMAECYCKNGTFMNRCSYNKLATSAVSNF